MQVQKITARDTGVGWGGFGLGLDSAKDERGVEWYDLPSCAL